MSTRACSSMGDLLQASVVACMQRSCLLRVRPLWRLFLKEDCLGISHLSRAFSPSPTPRDKSSSLKGVLALTLFCN